jgi:hypothetical protein
MKVFLYDTETGAYLGVGFSSDEKVIDGEGETTVTPPAYGHGEVAIFDTATSQWQVVGTDQFHTMVNGRT